MDRVLPGWGDAAGASRKRWSESLRAAYTRLDKADKLLELETHGTDSTRLHQSYAVSAYHEDLSAIANLQEALRGDDEPEHRGIGLGSYFERASSIEVVPPSKVQNPTSTTLVLDSKVQSESGTTPVLPPKSSPRPVPPGYPA